MDNITTIDTPIHRARKSQRVSLVLGCLFLLSLGLCFLQLKSGLFGLAAVSTLMGLWTIYGDENVLVGILLIVCACLPFIQAFLM